MWLDALFKAYRIMKSGGFPFPTRSSLNFVGGVLQDDPSNDATIVSFPGAAWIPLRQTTYTVQTTDTFIPTDTHAGGFTIYLPLSPTEGEEHTFADVTGHWGGSDGADDLNIEGNGWQIQDSPNITGSTGWGTIHLKWYASGLIWKVL